MRKTSYVVGNGRSSFVVLAPNMSSLTLLENGGGAQKRKQQPKPHGRSVFSPRYSSPSVALYPITGHTMCFVLLK